MRSTQAPADGARVPDRTTEQLSFAGQISARTALESQLGLTTADKSSHKSVKERGKAMDDFGPWDD